MSNCLSGRSRHTEAAGGNPIHLHACRGGSVRRVPFPSRSSCSQPSTWDLAGRAVGVDMTEAMCERARRGAAICGLAQVEVRHGEATAFPVEERSADVVISKGVLNLVPEKGDAIGEIRRILKPGGRVQIADIVIGTELPESTRQDIDLWAG
jgi:SAM-dependent methyltransferase